MQTCLFIESLIPVKTMNKHDVKFIRWKCIKNHFSCSGLSGKSQYPNYVFCGAICLFQLAEEHIETWIPAHNLSCSKVLSSVIVRTYQKWSTSYVFLLSGRVHMAQYVFLRGLMWHLLKMTIIHLEVSITHQKQQNKTQNHKINDASIYSH